jgi:hypothetical protein
LHAADEADTQVLSNYLSITLPHQMTASSRPASAKAVIARSTSALECPADIWMRMRAWALRYDGEGEADDVDAPLKHQRRHVLR